MGGTSTSEGRGEVPLLAERYRLEEVIGRGGMSEVFRATDVQLSRPVAVKVLLDGRGSNDRDRFVAEARTLARLSHTGLVTVYDAGLRPDTTPDPAAAQVGRLFLVMELVEGPTLADVIAAGPLPLDRAGAVGAQVAEALDYVHHHDVVHRDVKPANVLCGDQQHVKLADFGIARLLDHTTQHTGSETAVGTAAYVAPEQVRGEAVDGAADVYSLGLVLLEAITGRREYVGTPVEAAMARLHRQPDIPEGLPDSWRRLIGAMTDLNPERRPSAAEVAEWLRSGLSAPAPVATSGLPDATVAPILAGTAPVDVPTEEMAPPSPLPRTRRPARIVARASGVPGDIRGVTAALGALVLMLVVIALAAKDESEPTIPAATPTQLEEPLRQLHDAVDDAGLSELADRLDAVDRSVTAGDGSATRAALEDLVARTAVAYVGDRISDDEAGDVFDAARDVLAELPAELPADSTDTGA
ncbi:serine/threonine protein kinase [Nocardioides albidus]|uniref:non-specific serine/threonine protein kinase n=1 Tax=Nocardioides albidus TaxID=1517589 RepID=A0A5C4WPL9_9ACTN|nr:serine/threonine-protein kinase [Nocardioides albidus]TNM50214.1 serine/threonine protein kinase [Nocardioides albidus]